MDLQNNPNFISSFANDKSCLTSNPMHIDFIKKTMLENNVSEKSISLHRFKKTTKYYRLKKQRK